MRSVLTGIIVPAVAVAVATTAVHGQVAAPRQAAPFDGPAIPLPLPANILPTIPFLPGEVDVSSIGVADSELATVGPTSSASVHHNDVFLNDDGIGLFTTDGTEISHNNSTRNDFDGVFADSDTRQNTISYNRSDDNTLFDCEDDSAGPGTAGTANFWIQDLGDTQNRAGLCKATPR